MRVLKQLGCWVTFATLGACGAATGLGVGSNEAKGILDDSFNTNLGTGFTGPVDAIVVQADGKIVVGGRISAFQGSPIGSIYRLKSDGSKDTTFKAVTGFDERVTCLALQSDGKILVGGAFASYNGIGVGHVARLSADGDLDTDFNTQLGAGFDSTVNTVAVEGDGSLWVGGEFTTVSGVAAKGLAKLAPTGLVSASFQTALGTGFNLGVNAIAFTSSGDALVSGSFTTYQGGVAGRIVKLKSAGTLDTDFTTTLGAGFNSAVKTLAVDTNSGHVLAGGAFDYFQSLKALYFASFGESGSFDTLSGPNKGSGTNAAIESIAVQTNSKIVIGGSFEKAGVLSVGHLYRIDTDGSTDSSFNTNLGTGFDGNVQSLAVQPDGKILVGGEFAQLGSTQVGRLARLK